MRRKGEWRRPLLVATLATLVYLFVKYIAPDICYQFVTMFAYRGEVT
jgi:hypothetical protein